MTLAENEQTKMTLTTRKRQRSIAKALSGARRRKCWLSRDSQSMVGAFRGFAAWSSSWSRIRSMDMEGRMLVVFALCLVLAGNSPCSGQKPNMESILNKRHDVYIAGFFPYGRGIDQSSLGGNISFSIYHQHMQSWTNVFQYSNFARSNFDNIFQSYIILSFNTSV